jgi:hypothetical protein
MADSITRARKVVLGAGLALAGFVAFAPSTDAGIVVLKNGEVLVGRIRPDEDTQDELIMRWPYKQHTESGHVNVPKFRIRWYSRDADEPTDEYWEKYENEQIDSAWLPNLERWRIRKKSESEMNEAPIIEMFDTPRGKLSPVPVTTRDFEIRKPDGWTSSTEDGITIFVSDQPGADGYKARIHVFSVPSLQVESTERQVEEIQRQVGRLGQMPGNKFDVRELKRIRPVRGGFDQEMLTATSVSGRSVLALRLVAFRNKRTYFFSAYADERDYGNFEILFKACERSLVILEDQRAEGAKPGGAAPGGAAPGGTAPGGTAPGGAAPGGGTPGGGTPGNAPGATAPGGGTEAPR